MIFIASISVYIIEHIANGVCLDVSHKCRFEYDSQIRVQV